MNRTRQSGLLFSSRDNIRSDEARTVVRILIVFLSINISIRNIQLQFLKINFMHRTFFF